MIPGEVIFWSKYSFQDGSDADKLLVVANNQRNNQHVVFKTTSQPNKHRPNKEGCHPKEGYYHLPASKSWFKRDTWIVLNDPQILAATELDRAVNGGRAKLMTQLNDELVRAIINCFRKTDDCSSIHVWLMG